MKLLVTKTFYGRNIVFNTYFKGLYHYKQYNNIYLEYCNVLHAIIDRCDLGLIHNLEALVMQRSHTNVKNATSVNTFKCLYLKWKRLNDH